MKLLSKLAPLIFLAAAVIIFFKPFWLEGKLPVPADTIVGLYYPWRDFFAKDYPQGIPFKNFLITDPVRQQYIWRNLSIEAVKNRQWPLWNPYNFSGTPLLANFQSAPFYPLNILFFFLPFSLAWSQLIVLEPLLAGIFLYLYLRNLRLNQWASLLGAVVFSFSGFAIAWLEWNTVLHTALWLPLILLATDKLVLSKKWSLVFILSLASSFFAGHLQVFFYVFVFSLVYLLVRWWQYGRSKKLMVLLTTCYLLLATLTAVQWWPTLQFIGLSARNFDLPSWQSPGWFLPPQNLVQFLAPDFFGNPATLNYFGVWNYGEFIGYIGILPLLFSFLAILWRRDKKTWFFGGVAAVSLMLALPTPLAKLPYQLTIPFISTSQPTRLMFLIDFSLAVLAALGLDWLMKNFNDSNHLGKFIKTIAVMFTIFLGLWVFVLLSPITENLQVAKRNLILPTATFLVSAGLIILSQLRYGLRFQKIILTLFLLVVIFDLFRFGGKFTPFTDKQWLFPETAAIKFLQNQPQPFRMMATDRRIFPPNFAGIYKLEDVAGYDPLYLQSYGELTAAWGRGKPDITPFSFNRILTPDDYSSPMADLMNVKYVLSLKEEISPKLKLVFKEGETRVYENIKVLPRAFFVEQLESVADKKTAVNGLFTVVLSKVAVVQNGETLLGKNIGIGSVEISLYTGNRVVLKTDNTKEGFLVLTDIYYPGWLAGIDGEPTKIYQTDYAFRGIIIPAGQHEIIFRF